MTINLFDLRSVLMSIFVAHIVSKCCQSLIYCFCNKFLFFLLLVIVHQSVFKIVFTVHVDEYLFSTSSSTQIQFRNLFNYIFYCITLFTNKNEYIRKVIFILSFYTQLQYMIVKLHY